MIGSLSHIPYTKFALALGPVALIGLLITMGLVALFYRKEFFGTEHLVAVKPNMRINRVLVVRVLLATAVMIALFFAGQPPAKGGNHYWRFATTNTASEKQAHLCRDRLVASTDVRRIVHYRRGSATYAVDA